MAGAWRSSLGEPPTPSSAVEPLTQPGEEQPQPRLAALAGTARGQSFPVAQEGKSTSQQCLEIPIVQNTKSSPLIPYTALFPSVRLEILL